MVQTMYNYMEREWKPSFKEKIGMWIKLKPLKRLISDIYEKRSSPDNAVKEPEKVEQGWSIVVTTAGKDLNALRILIDSAVTELKNTPYEIILVGPSILPLNYGTDVPIRYVPFKELGISPGWITRKKNQGVRSANYDKVVVCHDYIIFSPGWKTGYEQLGDFTVASNIFLNKDGSRHKDWITWDHPQGGRGSLPYHANCTKYQYLNGAYFVVKRKFYIENPLDERLRWGEAEDIEWSKRIREITTFTFNRHSTITYSKQKPGDSPQWQENTIKLEDLYK